MQKGKKLMYRQFRNVLAEIANLSIDEQKNILHSSLEKWKGNHEQVDDILVIGFKIN